MQYINVNTELFYIHELNDLDRFIYSLVYSLNYNQKKKILFLYSNKDLSNLLQKDIRAIQRSIKKLVKYGLLVSGTYKGDRKVYHNTRILRAITLKNSKLYKEKYLTPDYNEQENEFDNIVDSMKSKLSKG